MSESEGLYEKLAALYGSGILPMHMPGHKRNVSPAPYLAALGAKLDITEIDGFDNLHEARGVLHKAQARAAELWGAKESFFLVNGSSCGILAGLYALCVRGDEVLLTRNAHKSVFHAVELLGLTPRFLAPEFVGESSVFASVRASDLEQAFEKYPKLRAVVVTSPNYDGILSEIPALSRVCHAHGAALFADEAHGAHLGLGGGFPDGAVKGGADLVVQSLHKTLLSLTQTAVLHLCSDRVDAQRLRHALAVFQTSSPSYLLMASIDACVTLLREKPEILSEWRENLRQFDRDTAALSQISLPLRASKPENVFDFDPSKLILHTEKLSGEALMHRLRADFGIELEMAVPDHALGMTGAGDTRESLSRFAQALSSLDRTLAALPDDPAPPVDAALYSLMPALEMTPDEALRARRVFVPWAQCAGAIAAEYVWAYPPGAAMVLPGERIGEELAQALSRAALPGHLHTSLGRSGGIHVVK